MYQRKDDLYEQPDKTVIRDNIDFSNSKNQLLSEIILIFRTARPAVIRDNIDFSNSKNQLLSEIILIFRTARPVVIRDNIDFSNSHTNCYKR